MNDQRIFWSGMEMSFGVEGSLYLKFLKKSSKNILFSELELYLNQPFGKNILTDEERKKYIETFKIDTIKISRLNLGYKRGNFLIKIGKDISNFGKFHYPIFINNYRFASPFIRSEAILLRETGIFFKWTPLFLSFDLGIVNGEEEKDTNSFKAGIARIGLNLSFLTFGVSVKAHDGIGSEQQKIYKNHLGVDFSIHTKIISLSGEFIYDQYGFHKEFNDSEIFWPTSFYYRDIFYKYNTPIEGRGGYLNLKIGEKDNLINISIGGYWPQKIGNIYHDQDIKRSIIKIKKKMDENFSLFLIGILENERKIKEPWREGEKPYAFLIGVEFKNEKK